MQNQAVGVEISGQKVWCGSMGVSQYLVSYPSFVDKKVVIELGAGTGILGMLAARLGAKKVILSDHDQISLDHMSNDCNINHIDANVVRLDWFSPDVDSLHLDFFSGEDFVILGGDVLYKHQLLHPFFSTAKLLLEKFSTFHSKGSMLLCHIPRANVSHDVVTETARSLGLQIQEIPMKEEWKENIRCSRSEMDNEENELCPEHDISRAKLYEISL